jgi:hypothetical protein
MLGALTSIVITIFGDSCFVNAGSDQAAAAPKILATNESQRVW